MFSLSHRFFSMIGPQTRGTGLAEYIMIMGLMIITAFVTISTAGKRIQEVYLDLGEEIAYVNREIATINIALDYSAGSWVIVDAQIEPVQEAVDPEEPGSVEQPPEEGTPTEDTTPPEESAPPEDQPPEEDDSEPASGGEVLVEVEDESLPMPAFRLTKNNGLTNAEIDFSEINAPHRAYEFMLMGTGDTNPRAKAFSGGSETIGLTLIDRIQIRINKPSKGKIETITLIIGGQTLKWTVIHDHGKR